MTTTDTDAFAQACAKLVGQIAANPSVADSILAALASGLLTAHSGPDRDWRRAEGVTWHPPSCSVPEGVGFERASFWRLGRDGHDESESRLLSARAKPRSLG